MKTKKKQPKDYPIFAFRISSDDKAWLEDQLEKKKEQLNRNLHEFEFVKTKNDIILEALKFGLLKVKRD